MAAADGYAQSVLGKRLGVRSSQGAMQRRCELSRELEVQAALVESVRVLGPL